MHIKYLLINVLVTASWAHPLPSQEASLAFRSEARDVEANHGSLAYPVPEAYADDNA